MKKNLLKRDGVQSLIASLLCVVLGLLIGYIVLLIINPAGAGEAITTVIKNFLTYKKPETQMKYFGNTLVRTAPLLMCSLSILFAYKAGLFNIGAAGQYCAGAGMALYAALAWHMPWWLCMIMAMLGGALLGVISGLLKSYCNVNEVISGIMLNWITLYVVNILLTNVKEAASPYTMPVAHVNGGAIIPSLGLGKLFNNNQYVTLAIPLAILIAVGLHILLEKTRLGYELKACGSNRHAARYAGINDRRNIVLSMAIAGGLAGAGAALYWLSGNTEFYWSTYQSLPGEGFNGIPVALLAINNPIGVVFTGIFMAMLKIVGQNLTGYTAYNEYITDVIIGVIVYLSAFSLVIRMWLEGKKKKENPANDANAEKGGAKK